MPFEWPDISQNQLMQVGLGLMGSGFGRGQTNPFQAAAQGLVYGSQADKLSAQEKREQQAYERQQRLEQAWAGMFGAGGTPQPDMTGMSPAAGAAAPQIASADPGLGGMGPQAAPGGPQGNPMLAGLPQGMAPLLAAMGPEQGASILMDRFNRKPKQRRIIQGADGFNYYEDTKERVLPGDEKPPEKPPAGYRRGEDGNLEADPGWLAAQLALKRAGKSDVNVKLPSQENEEAKAVGKWYGEAFTSLQDGATAARAANGRLDRIGQLLDGVGTGKTAPTTQSYKAAAKSVGIDLEALGITDDVGPAEAAQALSAQMALELRNPAGGAGMPGAMSDKDREFLTSMVPGLGTSPEGREMMIETQKRVNNRSIEVARMARDYRKANGRLDEGFYDKLDEFSAKNPLFDDMEAPKQAQVPPPQERQIGTFYQTPKGKAMWNGERWIPETAVPGGGQ
jgi:hypothetical protein